MLMRVSSRYFVAGLVFDPYDFCVRAAPILAYAKGRSRVELQGLFRRKGYRVEILPDDETLIPGRPAPAVKGPSARPIDGQFRVGALRF